jgi:hypothetical protein
VEVAVADVEHRDPQAEGERGEAREEDEEGKSQDAPVGKVAVREQADAEHGEGDQRVVSGDAEGLQRQHQARELDAGDELTLRGEGDGDRRQGLRKEGPGRARRRPRAPGASPTDGRRARRSKTSVKMMMLMTGWTMAQPRPR